MTNAEYYLVKLIYDARNKFGDIVGELYPQEEKSALHRWTAEIDIKTLLENRISLDRKRKNFLSPNISSIDRVQEAYSSSWDKGFLHGDARMYPIFNKYANYAAKIANSFNIGVVPDFLIGFLPIGSFNAAVTEVPETRELLVIIQSGLPLFLNRIIKILCEIEMNLPLELAEIVKFDSKDWPIIYNDLVLNVLDDNPIYDLLFFDIMTAFLIHGNPRKAVGHRIGASHNMRMLLLLFTEMFVIGHEIGHIIKGHIGSVDKGKINFYREQTETVEQNNISELEADSIGFSIVHAAIEEASIFPDSCYFMARSTPSLFFKIAGIINLYLSCYIGNDSETHPDLETRNLHFCRFLTKLEDINTLRYVVRFGIVLSILADRSLERFQCAAEDAGGIADCWFV